MNVDFYTFSPFDVFVKSHTVIKINGFYFLVLNKLALGKTNYYGDVINLDYFSTNGISPFSRYQYDSFDEWKIGSYDKNSNDLEYLEQVKKLKANFNISENSNLWCQKFHTYEYKNYNYYFYDVFVFNFDDIFQTPFSLESKSFYINDLDSYPQGTNYYLDSFNLLGLLPEHSTPIRNKSMRLSLNVFSNHVFVGIPIVKRFYNQYGDFDVSGASFSNAMFLKDGIYYYFRINNIPRLSEDKTTALVSYEVHKIELKKISCCLFDLFNKTNPNNI